MGELLGRRAEGPHRGFRKRNPLTDPLLAELRQDYSQWGVVASRVPAFRFWLTELAGRLQAMERAGLIEVRTEATGGLRMDVLAIAVQPSAVRPKGRAKR